MLQTGHGTNISTLNFITKLVWREDNGEYIPKFFVDGLGQHASCLSIHPLDFLGTLKKCPFLREINIALMAFSASSPPSQEYSLSMPSTTWKLSHYIDILLCVREDLSCECESV